MEKEFKHPEESDTKESSEGSSSSSESAAQASGSRTGDAERARFTRRKRIRAYQKIDYWQ